jgi:hypothetical protein
MTGHMPLPRDFVGQHAGVYPTDMHGRRVTRGLACRPVAFHDLQAGFDGRGDTGHAQLVGLRQLFVGHRPLQDILVEHGRVIAGLSRERGQVHRAEKGDAHETGERIRRCCGLDKHHTLAHWDSLPSGGKRNRRFANIHANGGTTAWSQPK